MFLDFMGTNPRLTVSEPATLNAVTVTSRGMTSQIYRQQGSSTPGCVASATSQSVFQRNMPSLGNSRPSLESARSVLRETPLGVVSIRLR
jgi:hypothetical protein